MANDEKDAYIELQKRLGPEIFNDIFNFGFENIIYPEKEKVVKNWYCLRERVLCKNKSCVCGFKCKDNFIIRPPGRSIDSRNLYTKLYRYIFKIDIGFDKNGNLEPTKLLENLTDYTKGKKGNIFNYQVAHAFERTKNIFCFVGPWNICWVPKYLDPLTGHETKGDFSDIIKNRFRKQHFDNFKVQIEDFNDIMDKISPKIEKFLEKENVKDEKEKDKIRKDFKKISTTW